MMKIVALIAVMTIACAAAMPLTELKAAEMTPELEFEKFMIDHGKQYETRAELMKRFQIFKDNKVRIAKMNADAEAAGKSTKFAVNQFADMTPEEFRHTYLSEVPAVRDPSVPVLEDIEVGDLPSSFDWREKGAVTPVKNQGSCGSCWAFSTTGNVEGQWFLKTGNLTSLSEQNLVDCDHHCMEYKNQKSCDSGCNGGLQPNAYQYIMGNGGIDTESAYPYEGVDGQCRYKAAGRGAVVNNYTMISEDETQIAAQLVARGPLAIAADAAEWQFYFGGVFDVPCGKSLDHGILIVGFGSQRGIFGEEPYWLIKNSWGPGWGEKGYLKIIRGKGKCGLNTFVSTSIIH